MALTVEPKALRILHIMGCREDGGGVLSVIRNLHAVTSPAEGRHVAWVNQAYREVRKPALEYRTTRRLIDEDRNHFRLLAGSLFAFPELARLLRAEPFDVLHGHSRGALVLMVLAARRLRRPVLFTNHSYARRIGLYRWAARQPGVTTCVLTPNMGRHYGLPMDAGPVQIVSACFSEGFLASPLPPPSAPNPGDRVRLVGLGNIVAWKNWHLVLEAIALLPPAERDRVEFHHWGPTLQGSDTQNYAEQLRRTIGTLDLGASCYFHGLSLSVPSTLIGASCFVIPSTNEPCSVALMESLASGLPALASASGGNLDIITPEKTGLLFEPGNVRHLAAQISRLVRGEVCFDPPLRIRASVMARRATAVWKQYLDIYRRILEPAGSGKEVRG